MISDHHREESENGEIEHFEASHKRCCDNSSEKLCGIFLIAGRLIACGDAKREHSVVGSSITAHAFIVENAFGLRDALHDTTCARSLIDCAQIDEQKTAPAVCGSVLRLAGNDRSVAPAVTATTFRPPLMPRRIFYNRAHEVTNLGNDCNQLTNMAGQARAAIVGYDGAGIDQTPAGPAVLPSSGADKHADIKS
ncbi:hypothetical protein [Paraburkholderia sp. BL18I3N2]|uniref:hypothetical protein n=1 Tax=Paraburkholderia sp. BL18I3N2 TaxID=1938799 RepID=UPI002158F2E0|nr:hypothetical protein [Paraburkholderia sp. BL18I3N2]